MTDMNLPQDSGLIALLASAHTLKGRSLLTLLDLTQEEMFLLVSLARALKLEKRAWKRGAALRPRRLDGKSLALIFEKASTRTRCSFLVAAQDEGAFAETFGKGDIHLGAKEDIADTARVLSRFFDGIEFRGFEHATVEALARHATVPVWNGLTDEHHPTQALADILTLQEEFGDLAGRRVVYLGDAGNNTCASLMLACAMAGIDFVMAAPEDYAPRADLLGKAMDFASRSGGRVSLATDPFQAVRGACALYTDVWVSMGEEQKPQARTKVEDLRPYQVTSHLMTATGRQDTIFLHCLPAHKGFDVTEDVFESAASRVFEQAENRLHTIKALMLATLR
jgi:ornithine carbamoyltransferase